MNMLDILGSFLSLVCTYLFIKQDIRAWPLSAIALPFDAYLYFHNQLYADFLLQIFYLFTIGYGWYQWRYGNTSARALEITYLTKKQHAIFLLITVIAIALAYHWLATYTVAFIALLDAITTVLSLCGQWLLCNKKIETWLVWLVVDGLYVYLYAIKRLPFHSAVYVLYLGMAMIGWLRWRQALNFQRKQKHVTV